MRFFVLVMVMALVGCGVSSTPPVAVGQSGTVAGQGSAKPLPAVISANHSPASTTAPVQTTSTPSAWLLHLPGIGGRRSIDVAMTKGFQLGGFKGDVEIYDWTEHDEGLHALIAYDRNHKEARLIAQKITDRFDRNPAAPIYITCHSGGGGIAVWALEYLPERVKISSLVMLSPALSPAYDLTAALNHVSGKVYVFSSLGDVLVLSTGCKLMGTIDGVKTAAAGYCGFVRPPGGDAGQYSKLVSLPYNPSWVQFDDYGNHVGGMTRRFGQMVIAPLVLSGKLPPVKTAQMAAQSNQTVQ